ncbi:MAG: hypothetical protein AB1421_02975 [Pseudomonadota bacterium]
MKTQSAPIFIHSQFRSGSTYLFHAFRRSQTGYWCYQEPENEILLDLTKDTDPLPDTRHFNKLLRHPHLDKPYLAEFFHIRAEVAKSFSKEFSYDLFFLDREDSSTSFKSYLQLLIEKAPSRAVLQFCRSYGRLAWLKQNFQALNLYLWRHPWDQWWSYKVTPYFDTANLLILNSNNLPNTLKAVRERLNFVSFHASTIQEEYAFFESHSLNSRDSYFLFYALWCHGMLEGLKHADIMLNIDALSASTHYRERTLEKMTTMGISGIDFSDCCSPQSYYSKQDADFFYPIENQVLKLFESVNDHTADAIAHVTKLQSDIPRGQTDPVRDLNRLRDLIKRNIDDNATVRHTIWDQHKEIDRLMVRESELLSIYNSWTYKALQPFLKCIWQIRAIYRRQLEKQKPAH